MTEAFGLAVAGEAAEADDFAAAGLEVAVEDEGAGGGRAVSLEGWAGGVTHGGDEAVATHGAGSGFGHHFAVAHDDGAVGDGEDLVEFVGDEDDGAAGGDEAADVGEEGGGEVTVEGGGGFVEDDDLRGCAGVAEGAGDLDGLAGAEREVADKAAGGQGEAREDGGEGVGHQDGAAAAPAEAGDITVHDAGVFGDAEVGAERALLEHETQGGGTRAERGRVALDAHGAGVGGDGAGEDVHEGGFTGAVMADHGQALALGQTQVDAAQGVDSAELLGDAGEFDRGAQVQLFWARKSFTDCSV